MKANDIRELLNHVNIPTEATFYDNIRGKDTAPEDSSETEVVEYLLFYLYLEF